MIIDAHCHIFSSRVHTARQEYCDDSGFSLLYGGGKGKIGTAETIHAYMEQQEIDYAWGMGFCWDGINRCEQENELILEECSRFNRITPFMGVPAKKTPDIRHYIRSWRKNGYKGIGEISFYRDGLTEENALYLREIFAAAAEENLPVCLHLNEPVGHLYPGKYTSDFGIIYTIIKDFPSVKTILAHFGGGILFYELMPEVKEAFKNVWYDTAAAPFIYDVPVYARAAAVAGSEKIIFGSDYPLLGLNRYEDGIRAYLDADEAEKILGLNAAGITA